jgi:hypothetical protein
VQRFALAAALLAAAATAGPALAQSNDATSTFVQRALDAAPRQTGGARLAFVSLRETQASPDTVPAFLVNFVAAGPYQTGVPCYKCVKGAQTTFNIGLSAPYNYVTSGSTWQYVASFTTVTFAGSCKIAWTITSGQKVIDSFSTTATGVVAHGSYIYGFNRTRPTYSGAATLSSKVTCKAGSQTATAPMYFQ